MRVLRCANEIFHTFFLREFERDIRFGAFFHFFLPNILSTRLVSYEVEF